MKKFIKKAGLLLVGLLISTTASAYYVSGSTVYNSSNNPDSGKYSYLGYYVDGLGNYVFGAYDGHIGNVNLGFPGGLRVGTERLVKGPSLDLTQAGNYATNSQDSFTAGVDNAHWYRFTVDVASVLDVFFEWDEGINSFTLELFEYGGSDTAVATASFDSDFLQGYTDAGGNVVAGHGHNDYYGFTNIVAGDYLFKLTGTANSGADGYGVYFDTTAVPLPPAALLFISALAGFGVIGRKRTSKAA